MFNIGRIRVVALALADAACLASVWAGVVCGYWALGRLFLHLGVRTGIGGYAPTDYLSFWPILPTFIVINAFLNLYQGNWMYPSTPHSPVEEFRRLFNSAAILHIGVIAFLAFRFQTTDGYSRVVISISGVLVILLAQTFRNWIRFVMFKLRIGQIPVLLAGGGAVADSVEAALDDNPYCGLRVVARFGEKRFHEILPEAKKRDIKILIACQDVRLLFAQLDEFSAWFTYVEYAPTVRAFPLFGSRPISFDGVGALEMVNQGRMKAKRVQKWLMDKALASIAFVLLSPLFVILPILIKLTSRGSVFYRQERLGRNGRPFWVWKFRSMYADADARLQKVLAADAAIAEEWSRNFKLSHDPRITPFGRLLRKTSLDELPQLFNVFAGDMALIGPRPIVQEEVKYYGDAYKVFSSVRPGVTGLWQVSGRSDTDYARRVALDTSYVLNWSPWMDIWILVRTVYVVLLMRGAR